MRFTQTLFAGAAFLAAALAVEITSAPTSVEAGRSYTIEYSPGGQTATTIELRTGDPGNLDNVAVLTQSATGGSFQWSVDAALPNGNKYALFIKQGSEENYWGGIRLTGGSTAPASSSRASSAQTSAATTPAPSSGVPPASSNGTTVTSSTFTRSPSPTETGGNAPSNTTGGADAPENTGAAVALAQSPLAFILGAAAAIAYLA